MLLGLAMIVRDEEAALPRTLDSVRGVVDRWTILDTGSVDGTKALVARALAQEGVVGNLYEEPFVDYAHARNRALDRCFDAPEGERSRYVLSLSADETLHGGDKLRAFLESYEGEESAFLIEVRTPTNVFPYPRVLRNGSRWRYEGEIQEMPVHQDDPARVPSVVIEGCWIEYAPTDPERFKKRLRERDLPLLMRQLEWAKTPTARARAILFLAQTREQLAVTVQGNSALWAQEEFSALGWYMLAAVEEHTPEGARDHATFKYLNVAEQLGVYASPEMVARLRSLIKKMPRDPAVAYMLATHVANTDPKAGLQEAYKAARVARDAVKDPEHVHDPYGLLWRPHLLAVMCARSLGHGPAAAKSAEAAMAAGAPREVWAGILKEEEIEKLYPSERQPS